MDHVSEQSSESESGCRTLLLTMKAKDALLLAYDTKSHKEQTPDEIPVPSEKWDIAEERKVEKKNEKVQLAQYCALAIAGNGSFGQWVHSKLLDEVCRRLEHEGVDKKQLLAKDAVKLFRNNIEKKVREAKDNKERKETTSLANRSMFMYGTWEKDKFREVVPKLIPIVGGKVYPEVDYKCLGIQEGAANEVMEKGWRENMSVDQGVELIQEAMAVAVKKDGANLLGGHLKICVLKGRDVSTLPLDIDEETQDRAITFIDVGAIVREDAGPIVRKN